MCVRPYILHPKGLDPPNPETLEPRTLRVPSNTQSSPETLYPEPQYPQQIFSRSGCDALGVDTLEDGMRLRNSNVTSVRIVVMYWSDPWAAALMIENGIEPTVWDMGWIAAAEVRPIATIALQINLSSLSTLHG